jgi:glycosyltransferase involved in cell wall biosynthesis
MISDPTFSNIVPLRKVGSAVQVTENWFAELGRAMPGANPRIKHAADGGLELQWDAAVGRARVWQTLDLKRLGAISGPLDFVVIASLSPSTSNIVEWIAILEHRNGDARFHTKLKLSVTPLANKLVVVGRAEGVRLEPDGEYRLCLQFSETPKHLTLHSVETEVSPTFIREPKRTKASSNDSVLLMQQLSSRLDASERIDPAAVERGVRALLARSGRTPLLRLIEYVGGIAPPADRRDPRGTTKFSTGGRQEREFLRASLIDRIERLAAMSPNVSYYPHLKRAVEATARDKFLFTVGDTLQKVDERRLGQVPYAGDRLVSVVMPAFNRAGLIGDAIRSVLAQSYGNFELLVCDDASDDETVEVVQSFADKRIRLLKHEERSGAAAARNTCLSAAKGEYIAYLDTDNLWHPRFLEVVLEWIEASPGHLAAYVGFFDIHETAEGNCRIRSAAFRQFHLEDQLEKPFVDLNSFVHSTKLYHVFGGFDERLVRRQDYDLIARYCWAREPLSVPVVLNLYRRLESVEQITRTHRNNLEAPALIEAKLASYYDSGIEAPLPDWLKKVSVISWDLSRNHFAKPYCIADALSRSIDAELVSFRFFEQAFGPLEDAKPNFATKYFEGGDFPAFFRNFAQAIDSITGDVIYAVKPRLTSLGLALLANYHTGKPIMLEVNDLETVVNSAKATDTHQRRDLEAVFYDLEAALVPHSAIWSQVLDSLVGELPITYTHNVNLNRHYGSRSLYMRNVKDERIYDPSLYDRAQIRENLGFGPDDRIILFGGLVRKHKGVFELVQLIERLGDDRYKLLIVGNRETPDLKKIAGQNLSENVTVLSPQTPQQMAELNYASDLVLLWLDPDVPASHYQSPYKMSDAFAMGPAIIASPTGDLADFSRRELLWNVPFGDMDGLVKTIEKVFENEEELNRRRERARRFFLREFSYNAVRPAFALGAQFLVPNEVYPVATRFAEFFAEFTRRASRL